MPPRINRRFNPYARPIARAPQQPVQQRAAIAPPQAIIPLNPNDAGPLSNQLIQRHIRVYPPAIMNMPAASPEERQLRSQAKRQLVMNEGINMANQRNVARNTSVFLTPQGFDDLQNQIQNAPPGANVTANIRGRMITVPPRGVASYRGKHSATWNLQDIGRNAAARANVPRQMNHYVGINPLPNRYPAFGPPRQGHPPFADDSSGSNDERGNYNLQGL